MALALYRTVTASSAMLLFVSLAGCSNDPYRTVPVTGHVFCNGKPAWGGTIVFQPLEASEKTGRSQGNPGRSAAGIVQKDGSFTLMVGASAGGKESIGALVGTHRVSFLLPKSTPWRWNPEDNWLPPEEQEKLKAELAQRPVYPVLPCGYNISPSEVEVQAKGKNNFDFTLQ